MKQFILPLVLQAEISFQQEKKKSVENLVLLILQSLEKCPPYSDDHPSSSLSVLLFMC